VRYEHKQRVLALAWLSADDLCVGGDDKTVTFYRVPDPAPRMSYVVGERIKALALAPYDIDLPNAPAGEAYDGFVVGATSAGTVFLLRPADGQIVAKGSAPGRLTCIAVNAAGFVADASVASKPDIGPAASAADASDSGSESGSASGSGSGSDDESASEADTPPPPPVPTKARKGPVAPAAAGASVPAAASKRKRDEGAKASPAKQVIRGGRGQRRGGK
jgi:hypothetical protein